MAMIEILNGDCREMLRTLDSESVHCVVTSPPYWGLRDYGMAGQIGLEETMQDHLALMVDVFHEVRRVLRKDGTLWLNYGDAYASSWGAQGRTGQMSDRSVISAQQIAAAERRKSGTGSAARTPGLKPKDRCLLPARLAIALCDDGWWVRDEIIWHKPNPMPISVRDRTTPAHEMLYMLSKSAKYHYDQDAIKEPIAETSKKRYAQETLQTQQGGFKQEMYESGLVGQRARSRRPAEILKTLAGSETRNRRSVWSISPQPFKEAHFATFPPKLIEPCILAGCPEGGTVLDPFFGAGTTGLVCQQLNRNCIGIELNPAYVAIAEKRLGLSSMSEIEKLYA